MTVQIGKSGEFNVGRRGASRLRLYVPAELILVDGQERCVLDDISRSGAQITVPRNLPVGTCCVLRCGRLEFFAEVVWTTAGRCGLAFDEVLDSRVLVQLRSIRDELAEVELVRRRLSAQAWVEGKVARL